MQTQNLIMNELSQLERNNKISILKAFTLYGLLSLDTTNKYSFLLAKLRAMLIPPENVLELITDTNSYISIWDKAFKLMEDGNVECKNWFESEEFLEFDFKTLRNDEIFMSLDRIYKRDYDEITKKEEYFKLYKDSLLVLKN